MKFSMLKSKFLVGALAFAVALGASGSFASGLGGWRDLMSKTRVTPEQVEKLYIGGIIFDPSINDKYEFIELAIKYQDAAVVDVVVRRFLNDIYSSSMVRFIGLAIELKSVDKVRVLVAHAHSVRYFDFREFKEIFLKAVASGFVDAASAILLNDRSRRSELVNCVDSDGFHTPLYYAIENGHYDMVDFLLRHGANVGFKQENGDTVLHRAAYTNHPGILIRLLQEPDAREWVNERNLSGHTPLHNAALGGCWEGIKPLIDAGADVNCFCVCWRVGKLPLDHAVDEKTAYELCKYGGIKSGCVIM